MLRKRKTRRYNEETNDEEGDGERKFDIKDQINSERFDLTNREKHLLEFSAEKVTLKYIQQNGFEKPILVAKPEGLDLRVPPKSFLVRDVRDCVGHQRIIDVMDVKTQKNIEMTMKEWCKYYESKSRYRLLNVISLEFSHTKLDDLVESPMIVKLLDWVDLVWPKFLKQSQTESTNTIDKMKYPKVQKYCLMSVKGSYTDFHIDFGGTSVWYHILRGKKIFWMVPPTELNLSTFEEWTLSGMQQNVFFGDTVEECFRVELCAGNTFFIPSGWIHAVYTLEDSLVFGGNFLHSFGIENQLKVSKIEDSTKVPAKFRYPFYTEILWYVVQHYVHCLTGKDHLQRPSPKTSQQESEVKEKAQVKTIAPSKGNSIDIYEQSTESEPEEKCDIKKRKAPASRKRKGKKPTKPAPKKTKKQTPTDDESTEIESGDETATAQEKPTTCRMTKNSLLRLQYEIEDKKLNQQQSQQQQTSKSASKQSKSLTDSPSPVKQKVTSTPNKQVHNPAVDSANATVKAPMTDTAEPMAQPAQETKLNGWASTGTVRTTWSNSQPKPDGPPRIHLTRYELNGLKALVKHLSKLSGAKKNLPALIRNSRALLDDCRKLIAEHENDSPELAATGRPITHDMLSSSKPADINEMIRQFFKSETESEGNVANSQINSTQSRSRHNSTTSFNEDDKKSCANSNASLGTIHTTGNSTSLNDTDSHETTKLSHKETKCLSPNKKSASTASNSSASLPARPKSPPTRPLSYNQYDSKPKINNNLLLPGSFADLIAATSTEKKVFDISGSDVASSLFGGKDHPPSKSPVKSTIIFPKSEEKTTPSTTVESLMRRESSESPTLKTSTRVDTQDLEDPPITSLKVNSPEPPKTPVQKRFINPTFRPHNKERLIFASAPYVSPIHTIDQSRQPRGPPKKSKEARQLVESLTEPVQLHTQKTQPQPQAQQMSVPVPLIRFAPTTTGVISQAQAESQAQPEPIAQPQVQPELIAQPQVIKPSTQAKVIQPPIHPKVIQPSTHKKVIQAPPQLQIIPPSSQIKVIQPPTQTKVIQLSTKTKVIQPPANPRIIQPPTQQLDQPKPKAKRSKKQKEGPTQSTSTVQTGTAQILPNTTTRVIPQTQPSVICGLVAQPPSSSASGAKANHQSYLISRPFLFNQPMSAGQYQQISGASIPVIRSPASAATFALPMQQGARIVWATQPRGFAGPVTRLVAPSTTANSGAIQSNVSNLGHAIAVNPSLAQAARVVSSNSANIGVRPTLSGMGAHGSVDNAALLSLATTALSTAPMTTTQTLSHVGTRPPATQAIMVGGSSGQPNVFSNQQFFSPLMQGLPMTHFLPRHGAPRPSGQVVYARLPNQNQQARFLITQPGFMAGQRLQHHQIISAQPNLNAAFPAFKPPADQTKVIKTKKVKSS